MGFHKRYIDSIITEKFIKKNNLKKLYSSDILIFDDKVSSLIYTLFQEKKTIEEIKKTYYERTSTNI